MASLQTRYQYARRFAGPSRTARHVADEPAASTGIGWSAAVGGRAVVDRADGPLRGSAARSGGFAS